MKTLKKLKLDSEKMKFEILNEGLMMRIKGGSCYGNMCDNAS